MGNLKNILLTGATGFLGSHILEQLLSDGYKPTILIRENSDCWRINKLLDQCNVYTIKKAQDNFLQLFEEHSIEGVIHTATNYGHNDSLANIINTNVVFPLQLIDAGLKSKLILFINTDSFFAKPQFSQSYLNDYTCSKRMLATLLQGFKNQCKIVNMRLEHVYGEFDGKQKFVPTIFKQLLDNNSHIAFTDATQKRDFVYVKDVAKAYLSVLSSYDMLESYEEFEIGTGKSIPVKDFVTQLAEITGSESILKFGALEARKNEISDSFANTLNNNKIGWRSSTDASLAIKNMINIENKK